MMSVRLLSAILLLISASSIRVHANQHETCRVSYQGQCSASPDAFSGTTNVFFRVERTDSNVGDDAFNATVTFHWGETDFSLGTRAYGIGVDHGLEATHNFTDEGTYMIGYTVVFEDDRSSAACSGQTFTRLEPLKLHRTPPSCQMGDVAPSPLVVPALPIPATPAPVPIPRTCNVAYQGRCDVEEFSGTTSVFFRVESADSDVGGETFNATVTFHWGETNFELGTKAYGIGVDHGLEASHNFTDAGIYTVGYTVVFVDDRSGACSGQTYTRLIPLKMNKTPLSCQWNAPATLSPVTSPAVSPGPTRPLANTGENVSSGIDSGIGGSSVGNDGDGGDSGDGVDTPMTMITGMDSGIGGSSAGNDGDGVDSGDGVDTPIPMITVTDSPVSAPTRTTIEPTPKERVAPPTSVAPGTTMPNGGPASCLLGAGVLLAIATCIHALWL